MNWRELCSKVIDGHRLQPQEGWAILETPVEEVDELRRTACRKVDLDVSCAARKAGADRFEGRLFARPQAEELRVSFFLVEPRQSFDLTVRADFTGKAIASTERSHELDVDADFRGGHSNDHEVPGVAGVEARTAIRESGFAVLTEGECDIGRIHACGPSQDRPQCGSRDDEAASGCVDSKPLGPALLLW